MCLGGIASRPSEESPSGPGREISHQWPSAPQRGIECLGTRRPLGTGESCLGVVEVPAKLFSFVAPLITNIFSVHEVQPYDVCYGSSCVHSNFLCLPFSSTTHTRPWVSAAVGNLTPPNRNHGSFRSTDGKTPPCTQRGYPSHICCKPDFTQSAPCSHHQHPSLFLPFFISHDPMSIAQLHLTHSRTLHALIVAVAN